MIASAEVVVIGAGVMGASVAYHLAARGMKRILVLDRCPAPGGAVSYTHLTLPTILRV